MTQKSLKNPSRATVVAEISIDQAVAAIEHFAEHFAADRYSRFIANRVIAAGEKIGTKADAAQSPAFNVGGCLSGRMDASKPNPSNTPKSDTFIPELKFTPAHPHREPMVGEQILCGECLTWRNKCGPNVHQPRCSQNNLLSGQGQDAALNKLRNLAGVYDVMEFDNGPGFLR